MASRCIRVRARVAVRARVGVRVRAKVRVRVVDIEKIMLGVGLGLL